MAKNRDSEVAAVVAFIAGAAIAAGLTLLLTPRSGREIRGKLGDVTDEALQKLKEGAREAKFKVSKKTRPDAFYYDGGDFFV